MLKKRRQPSKPGAAYCDIFNVREARQGARLRKPRTREGTVTLLDYFGSIVESAGTLNGNYCWAGKPMRDLAVLLQANPGSHSPKRM